MKDINVTLGEGIKRQRKDLKITREQLAELINVSPRFLADVESGKVGVSLQTLKTLCEVLHSSADYFLGLTKTNFSKAETLISKIYTLDEKFYSSVEVLLDELSKISSFDSNN